MKIAIIAIGKKHDKDLILAIEKYQKRLKKFCDLSWEILTASNVDSESLAISKALKEEDYVILLDQSGQSVDNQELAEVIENTQNQSVKRLVFVIGGSYGVNYSIIARANMVMSVSALVFPHQLMRLLLVEQLYRSYSILSGGEYHHE